MLEYLSSLLMIPAYIRNISKIDVQNVIGMGISAFSLYMLVNEQNGNYDSTFCKIIFVYGFIDLFFTEKTDVTIHHLCILLGASFNILYIDNPTYYSSLFLSSLRNTEFSSIFYILLDWIPAKYTTLVNINKLLFITTFFKFRIYDFYNVVIVNHNMYEGMVVFTRGHLSKFIHCYGAAYIFYALNLYWFAIILKKLYKGLCKNIESYELAENILQYTYSLCIPTCVYTYFYGTTLEQLEQYIVYYYYEIIGIAFLAACSYLYHAMSLYRIEKYGVSFNCADKYVWTYMLDNIAIRIRVQASIYANTMIRSSLGHNTSSILFICTVSNLFSGIFISLYLLYLYVTKQRYLYDLSTENSVRHSNILDTVSAFPILVVSLCMCFGINDIVVAVKHMVVLYIIIILSLIKPFYKMNHTVIHIMLIYQTWILCNINTLYHPIK